MPHYLLEGTILGLTAGFAPGPLLALVVSETLRRGTAAGVKVALAPLVTDIPIVAAALLLLGGLSSRGTLLGIISLGGAAFLLRLGWENITMGGAELAVDTSPARSFRRGVAVNALSPHPYLFWLTVGGPITWQAAGSGGASALAFVASFYVMLLGSKIALALAVGRSRDLLRGRPYLWTMKFLGLLLCLLALMLVRDGFELLMSGQWAGP